MRFPFIRPPPDSKLCLLMFAVQTQAELEEALTDAKNRNEGLEFALKERNAELARVTKTLESMVRSVSVLLRVFWRSANGRFCSRISTSNFLVSPFKFHT